MNSLKGYFHPISKKDKDGSPKKNDDANPKKQKQRPKPTLPPPIEMTVTPPMGSPAFGSPALGSPMLTPMRIAMSSRGSSLYPEGDFRNSGRESILDIKSDVMVTYLNQQQMEKLWANNLPEEGCVLKKGRDNFTCSPASLRYTRGGLFDQVVALNVRVSVQLSG